MATWLVARGNKSVAKIADIQIRITADSADFSFGGILPHIISSVMRRCGGILGQPDFVASQGAYVQLELSHVLLA